MARVSFLMLVVLSVSSQALRRTQRGSKTKDPSRLLANETQRAVDEDEVDDINNTLTKLDKVDPRKVTAELIVGISRFNWSQPVLPQAVNLGRDLFGVALSMVNPLLGAAFSVFGGLMGWGGKGPNMKGLIKKLLAQVSKMITEALDEYDLEQLNFTVRGITENLVTAVSVADFEAFENSMIENLPFLFKDCWGNTNHTAQCKDYRINSGGFRALMYELQVVEMLATSILSMHDLKMAPIRLKGSIIAAAERLVEHTAEWRAYRARDWSGPGGVSRGSARILPPGHRRRSSSSFVRVFFGTDHLKNVALDPLTEFPGCVNLPMKTSCSRHCSEILAHMNSQMDLCYESYKQNVTDEVIGLENRSSAIKQFADSINTNCDCSEYFEPPEQNLHYEIIRVRTHIHGNGNVGKYFFTDQTSTGGEVFVKQYRCAYPQCKLLWRGSVTMWGCNAGEGLGGCARCNNGTLKPCLFHGSRTDGRLEGQWLPGDVIEVENRPDGQ